MNLTQQCNKLRTRCWLWLAAGVLACGAQKSSDERLGGETHWLLRCAEASDCGTGLDCLCGRCTEVCTAEETCQHWDAAASCLPATDVAFAADCAEPPPRLCALPSEDPTSVSEPGGAETCDQPGLEYFCLGEGCCAGADIVCEPDASGGFESACGCGCNRPPEGNTARVVKRGQRFDAAGACASGPEIAGTIAYGQACALQARQGVNPAGECFRFDDGCVPDGFAQVSADTVCRACDAYAPWPVTGTPYDEQRGCFGESTDAGTRSNHNTCSQIVTTALAPDGACWQFSSNCIPDDFVEQPLNLPCASAQRCADLTDAAACARRDLDSCEQDAACSLNRGFPYDEAEACFLSESIPRACQATESVGACPPVTTAALDDLGNCFSFGGCVPAGFTRAPDAHPCRQFAQCL